MDKSRNNWVLLFPGQGSQIPGMGQYLVDNFDIAKKTFQEASESLGVDMTRLCLQGSEQELALTENTQPALVLISTATFRVLQSEFLIEPLAAAGHSVGEYSALVASQVLSFPDALKSVRKRGQAMQSAVPLGQGGMIAAIGLDELQVQYLCDQVTDQQNLGLLSPANFNCPGQIVLSGSTKAIEWIQKNIRLDEIPGSPRRARLIPLNVSAPFHCSMMKPAEQAMKDFLMDIPFADAKFPVIQNVHAQAETRGDLIRKNLITQICAPVLWTQSIQTLIARGMTQAIECGIGRVVAGLVKKIAGDQVSVFTTNQLEELDLIQKVI